jgi:hypothetical protein
MMLTSWTYDVAFPQVCLSFQELASNNNTQSDPNPKRLFGTDWYGPGGKVYSES